MQRAAAVVVERVLSPQAELLDMPADRVERVRKAGRPVGSASRRHEADAAELIKRFGDARLQQLAVATMPLAELVALGMTVAEAMDRQRLAMVAVAPYLYRRLPQEVSVTGRQVIHLTIGDIGEGDETAFAADAKVVEYQEVRDGASGEVAQPALARPAQPVDDAGETGDGAAD